MSDTPPDPAQESIDQAERDAASPDDQPKHVDSPGSTGRTGSYETNNRGGYGTGQPDADNETHSAEGPVEPPSR